MIDTEGLFSITNEKGEAYTERQNFDSKLVLFCLAVSDFVIVNARGNLDSNTKKIMKVCKEKLCELNKNK